MALNEVIRSHSRGRLRVLCASAHSAGDYVYEKGFYGWVQDDIAANTWGVLHLDNVVEVARVASTLAMGTKLHAPATSIATTLPLIAAATNGQATTGWNAVGRTIATGNATVARMRQFGDNAY